MAKITNKVDDRFNEQTKLLEILCDCYDQRSDILALSIAVSIRVLVHDTQNSTSLLKHTGKKNTHEYLSTNFKNPNQPVHLGLVRRINVGVCDGVGGEAKYWPLCDEKCSSTPNEHFKYLPFSEWWDRESIFENPEFTLTRKDLVLAIANKDGGAHVDCEVDRKYDNFRKSYSGGSTLVGKSSGRKREYDNIPTYPAVRQIAHELLQSIHSSTGESK